MTTSSNFTRIDLNSRKVLVAEAPSTGIPIFVDNTLPQIISTSIDQLEVFENAKDFPLSLNAQELDAEHNKEQLGCLWSVLLFHHDNIHLVSSSYRLIGEAVLNIVPCDAQKYFFL